MYHTYFINLNMQILKTWNNNKMEKKKKKKKKMYMFIIITNDKKYIVPLALNLSGSLVFYYTLGKSGIYKI